MKLIIALLVALCPFAAMAAPLELVCEGVAVVSEAKTTTGTAETWTGQSISGSQTTYEKARTVERVRLKTLDEQTGSIKLPPAMVPPIHSGGSNSWWPLTDFKMNDATITGTFRLNIFNKGHIVIDRHTGDIEVYAFLIRFNGSCIKADVNPSDRLF